MSRTKIIDTFETRVNTVTGEITESTTRVVKKGNTDVTDEYIKVSRYLSTIFAFHGIPLSLVTPSLVIAQRMEFKTNIVYLLKSDKEEMAKMLGVSADRLKAIIRDCKKYDIIRPTGTRGKYAVNPFLFSRGSEVETRDLQAVFDFEENAVGVVTSQQHRISKETVKVAVMNKKNMQIPGQLSLFEDKKETKKNDKKNKT